MAWPDPQTAPGTWRRLLCHGIAALTLGAYEHRWITISHDPKRRFCTRCKAVVNNGVLDRK